MVPRRAPKSLFPRLRSSSFPVTLLGGRLLGRELSSSDSAFTLACSSAFMSAFGSCPPSPSSYLMLLSWLRQGRLADSGERKDCLRLANLPGGVSAPSSEGIMTVETIVLCFRGGDKFFAELEK